MRLCVLRMGLVGLEWGYALFAYIFNNYAHALGVMSENFG